MTVHAPIPSKGPIPPSIKGWCPGALQPMRSGDGLVVRLRLASPVVPPALARAIAELSRSHGNGQIDLTQRANLQLRGVSDATWPDLLDRLGALGLIDTDVTTESVRNIVVSPFLGPHCGFDALAASAALQARIVADPAFRSLPAKFGFVIDAGGNLPLDWVAADIRFVGEGANVAVEIGDHWRIGTIAAADIPDVAARLVTAFLSVRGEGPTAARRIRDVIARDGAAAIARAAAFEAARIAHRARRPDPTVIGPQPDFFGLGVPFGRLTAESLAALADIVDQSDARDFRLTPWRAVLIPGTHTAALNPIKTAGFITSPVDPRLIVAACSARPSARVPPPPCARPR